VRTTNNINTNRLSTLNKSTTYVYDDVHQPEQEEEEDDEEEDEKQEAQDDVFVFLLVT